MDDDWPESDDDWPESDGDWPESDASIKFYFADFLNNFCSFSRNRLSIPIIKKYTLSVNIHESWI